MEFVLDMRCQWSINFFTIFPLQAMVASLNTTHIDNFARNHLNSEVLSPPTLALTSNEANDLNCERAEMVTRCKYGEKYARGALTSLVPSSHQTFQVKFQIQGMYWILQKKWTRPMTYRGKIEQNYYLSFMLSWYSINNNREPVKNYLADFFR